MSIEEILKQQYDQMSSKLSAPPDLDAHVIALIAAESNKERGSHLMKRTFGARRNLRLMVGIMMIALLLSGFGFAAQKLLFHKEQGMIQTEVWTTSDLSLDETLRTNIQESLDAVKRQLQEDEQAIVYVAALENSKHPLYKQNPLLSVSKRSVIADLEAWKNTIHAAGIRESIANQLDVQFYFKGGKEEPAFGGMLSAVDLDQLGSLRDEALKENKNYAWMLRHPDENLPMDIYTTIYTNGSGEHIYVQMDHSKEKVKLKLTSPDHIIHDRLDINGVEALYMEQDGFLFSTTGIIRELSWMPEHSDSVIVRVLTDSRSISKDQLIQAAHSLQ